MRLSLVAKKLTGAEAGFAFLETLCALALVGTIVIGFLNGLGTTSRAVIVVDEQTTAESLARTQMEWVKSATYEPSASYSAAAIPGSTDYTGYSVNITAASLNIPDDGIQKITVKINHSGKDVITLEGYKVNR